MIPTAMLGAMRAFAVTGLFVACAADPGAQPLQPTSSARGPSSLAVEPPAMLSAQASADASDSHALSETPAAPAPAAVPPAAPGDTAHSAEAKPLELPSGTTVLHVGDSFAGALGPELNRVLGEHGVRGVLKQEKATYIPTWASRKELTGYLNQYKPDLVLITLGGNELGIGKPEERAETIARLVKRFEGTPCVWIGIPLWKGANPTLLEVIRKNVAPCRYLDSNALVPNLERAKDQIHPSLNARKVWAEAVVRWLAEQRVPNADKPWALK